MKEIKTNIIKALLATTILAGCAGTGYKNYGDYLSATQDVDYASVVVYRQPMFLGGGTIFTINLNGTELGTIGNDEFLVGEMQEGKNYLEVKVDGVQGVGLNIPVQEFEKTTDRNVYFKVGYMTAAIGQNVVIYIQEISPQEFKILTS